LLIFGFPAIIFRALCKNQLIKISIGGGSEKSEQWHFYELDIVKDL
jgi:hypothetical protein